MKLGFVGVGNMGNPMALNLLKAGHSLQVYDIKQEAAGNLIEDGATWGRESQGRGCRCGSHLSLLTHAPLTSKKSSWLTTGPWPVLPKEKPLST